MSIWGKRVGKVWRVSVGLSLAIALSACGSDDAPSSEGTVPTETVPVYLATALACQYLDREDVTFTPLLVEGPDYSTTVDPSEDCAEQAMFNTYVFDVPMPSTGKVSVTPGDQPAATLDAAEVRDSDGVTIFYARKGSGTYEISVMEPGRDEAMGNARR